MSLISYDIATKLLYFSFHSSNICDTFLVNQGNSIFTFTAKIFLFLKYRNLRQFFYPCWCLDSDGS
mgnify:CR=1 FL=1